MENKELANVGSIVSPAVSPEIAVSKWKEYQVLKDRIKDKEDIQIIAGREYLKKSYWRKIARFFNLSVEIIEERKEDLGDGNFAYHFKARAIAPNGAFSEGVGSCDNSEKGLAKSIHNTRTIAETRAWNRSVSNLIGAGEVSAEEISEIEEENGNGKNRDLATDPQRKKIFAVSKNKGLSEDQIKAIIKSKYGVESTKDLTKHQASELIDLLENTEKTSF